MALSLSRGTDAGRAKSTTTPFSMRQTLTLSPEDLIALFDENPATKVGEREVFEETDFLVPAEMLQHRIDRLTKLIAASKTIVEGLSVRVMKLRRGDDILDKPTREKYKREENARIARSNVKLSLYRAALRAGNYHQKVWQHQVLPVYFHDLVDDVMTFTEYGKPYCEDNEMVSDVIATRIFDVTRYEAMMQLDQGTLRLAGKTEEDQQRAWSNVQRWENAVIKAAVFHGVLRPRADLIELLALTPFAKQALGADVDVEADETENALALKTGGACYGGGIKSSGYRFRNGGFRRRALESFDKGKPPRGERDGDGTNDDPGFTGLNDVNDDAESYQPN
jgi:hypothetical protein